MRAFVLVVVDRETGEFTMEGPMTDDRPWNSAVVDAQRIGRNIRCFGMGDQTVDSAAAEWKAKFGGKRVAAGSIVLPTLADHPDTVVASATSVERGLIPHVHEVPTAESRANPDISGRAKGDRDARLLKTVRPYRAQH